MKKLMILFALLMVPVAFAQSGDLTTELYNKSFIAMHWEHNLSHDNRSQFQFQNNSDPTNPFTITTDHFVGDQAISISQVGTTNRFELPEFEDRGIQNLSFMGWYKFNADPGGNNHMVNSLNPANSRGIFMVYAGASNTLRCVFISDNDVETTADFVTTDITDGGWHHIACTYEQIRAQGTAKLYINGTEVASQVDAGVNIGTDMSQHNPLTVGGSSGLAPPFDGLIDEWYFWNETLNASAIQHVYELNLNDSILQNIPAEAPTPGFDAPTVTINSPVADTLTNKAVLPINYTITVDDALSVSNVTVLVNGTINKTVFSEANTTIEIGDGNYDITVIVFDNASQSVNDTVLNVIVDTINPFDNLLTQIPSGSQYAADQNITITAFNSNLFGHNVTVFNSDNEIVFSQEVLNISAPEHQITIQIDVSTFGVGTFTVFSNESDDHTANRIKDYTIGKDVVNKRLNFDTGKAEIQVSLNKAEGVAKGKRTRIDNKLQSLQHSKQIDRYNFGFNFQSMPTQDYYVYEFDVISDEKIYYRPGSGYQGHFVIGDDHWLDFEGAHSVDVKALPGNSYRVTVTSTEKNVEFDSIGGTNQGGSESDFEIIAPTISNIECDFQDGFETCAANVNDVHDQTRSTCINATSASVTIRENNTIVVNAFAMTAVGDVYTGNHSDITIEALDYNVSISCANDAGSSQSDVSFTGSSVEAAGVTSDSDIFIGVGVGIISILILLFLIGALFLPLAVRSNQPSLLQQLIPILGILLLAIMALLLLRLI